MLRKNKYKGDKAIIESQHPKPTFEQRLELMIWGDSKLGIVGIKGRMEKMEKFLKVLLGLSIVTALTLIDHLAVDGTQSSILSMLVNSAIKIFGGVP